MSLDHTPNESGEDTVFFRCLCGNEVRVDRNAGGDCPKCHRKISPQALQTDFGLTMTLNSVQAGIDPNQNKLPNASDHVGKHLDHFEILESLGQGGMGQVYRALDRSLNRYVAVKILQHVDGPGAKQQIDTLLQEAVAQARVNHPHVATIYYVGREEKSPFLAMELVDGGTLADRIKDGPMNYSDIAPVAMQIAVALKASHELDIVHGDIKPNNLLVKTSGQIKLSDFGMARSASKSDDGESKIGGTPNYLAPELLEGESPSIQSDMYALGVTLYEMTFGRLPVLLSGSSFLEWKKIHEVSKIAYPDPWPDEIPRGWKTLLDRLLNRDPTKRYADYDEVLVDLWRLQPSSSHPARRLPRIIATAIDTFLVALAMLPILILLQTVESTPFINNVVIRTLTSAGYFLPIGLYTFLVTWLRQSLGRRLMHLRVVNQVGLVPSSRIITTRSFLRMVPMWLLAFASFTFAAQLDWLSPVTTVLSLLALFFVVADVAVMIAMGEGKSLHDLIMKTQIVLDMDQG